jgi:hypothetical protein
LKKLCYLLIFILIFTTFLSSCGKSKEESGVAVTDRTAAFNDFYSSHSLVCWQDVAAVYLAKKNIADYKYSEALQKSDSYEDKAGIVISVSLLSKLKIDVSSYKIDVYVSGIKKSLENNYESLTMKQLAFGFFAMTASGTDFNCEAATKYIQSKQNSDGGFPMSKDIKISDAESSAYALNIITLNRKFFSDDCYNKAVTYLGKAINDDNTITDANNKRSSPATALTLNSLISANLPLDGEISTALTTAIDTNFKMITGSVLDGYKKYADDKSINREATGEVMLCFASTAYGNLWNNLKEEKESTTSS